MTNEFKQACISAYQQYIEARNIDVSVNEHELNAQIEAEVEAFFEEAFKTSLPEGAIVNKFTVTVGDIKLVLECDEEGSFFRLLGVCPKCEQECLSEWIMNSEDLGKQLVEFTPSGLEHTCPTPPEPERPTLPRQVAQFFVSDDTSTDLAVLINNFLLKNPEYDLQLLQAYSDQGFDNSLCIFRLREA